MKKEIHNILIFKFEKNGTVYNAFDDYTTRNFLSSMVIDFIKESGDIKKSDLNFLVLPKIANAIFLTLYSDFEYFLITLCKAYKETLDLRLSFSDLKGDGVIKAMDYLDKVAGIEVKNNKYYQELPHWNKIRNLLIHNSGIISESALVNIKALDIKAAQSLGNEVIALSSIDIDRFLLTVEEIQKYLIKK